jgi:hypothetical protein
MDLCAYDPSVSEKARRIRPNMAQSEQGNARRSSRERSTRRSPFSQLVSRVWSNWRVEVVIAAVVALAVFLLLERMEIRQTLLVWARRSYQTAEYLLGGILRGLEAAVRRTTISDLTALVLLAVSLVAVTWRIRWRMLRTPRYTARTCPLCGEDLQRTHRRLGDRVVNVYVPVRRYRCRNRDCGWNGLRVGTGVSPPEEWPAE